MRDYNKVGSRLHSSRRFQQLSDAGKLVYYYLLTTRHANSIGLFEIATGYIAVDYGWREDAASQALNEVAESGLVDLYEPERLVRIDKHFIHNPITNAKHAAGAIRLALAAPPCPIRDRVIRDLSAQEHIASSPELTAMLPDVGTAGSIGVSEVYDRAIRERNDQEITKKTGENEKPRNPAENSQSDRSIIGLSTTETETETQTERETAQSQSKGAGPKFAMSASFEELLRRLETILGKKLKSQSPIVHTWKATGLTDDTIVAIVHDRFNRWRSNNPGESISSLRYFDKAVLGEAVNPQPKQRQPYTLETIDAKAWEISVRLYREYLDAGRKPDFKRWHHDKLTPAPDEPGCKAPAKILERHQFHAVPTKAPKKRAGKANGIAASTAQEPPEKRKGKPRGQSTKTEAKSVRRA